MGCTCSSGLSFPPQAAAPGIRPLEEEVLQYDETERNQDAHRRQSETILRQKCAAIQPAQHAKDNSNSSSIVVVG